MIIDFHTHIFPDKIAKNAIQVLENKSSEARACTDGTISGLLSHIKDANIDLAITLPVLTKPTQFNSILDFALNTNKTFLDNRKGVLSFGGIHPLCEDLYGKLKLIKQSGLLGIKIHPDYQETFIDDSRYVEILQIAKELDLIVVTHAGYDFAYPDAPIRCTPERVVKVIEKVKHDKFVLAHYGGVDLWEQVYDILAGQNVYLDTSCIINRIDESVFVDILNKHGDDKVLFASDCPWRNANDTKNYLLKFGLSKESYDKIFYKNAIKLLGI